MSKALKEVLFVGLGAVGTIYSFLAQRSRLAKVTAVARSNYDIVKAQGIHINSQKYGNVRGWKPDRLCKSVEESADSQYSYVVVSTKAIPELTSLSQILSPFLSTRYNENFKQPVYVVLQNGLNVEQELFMALSELLSRGVIKETPRIIGVANWVQVNLREPNVVDHTERSLLKLGAYRHQDYTSSTNTVEEEEFLGDFARLFDVASVVPEIQRVKFAKNFWNVSFGSFATLTGYTLPAIFRPPPPKDSPPYTPFVSPITADLVSKHSIPVIRKILEELVAVGRALGFPDSDDGLPSSIVDSTLKRSRGHSDNADSIHIPSMLLDARNHRPLEVEVTVGEVVRMAQAHNVEIPHIEAVYALLLVIQNQMLQGK